MSSCCNQNIWEYNNDPKRTIICLIKRKFIKNPQSFKLFVTAVQDQTNCEIHVVGLEKEEEHFWISIQSDSKEARQQAYFTVNAIVSNECKIIELPQFDIKSKSSENFKKFSSTDEDEDFLDEHSFPARPKSSMIRSTTTEFSANKITQDDTKPFGSVLSKFKMTSINDENIHEHLETPFKKQVDENNNNQIVPLKNTNNIVIEKKSKGACCYSVNFMLSRAESVHSKKIPINWKELNEKYPNFCFYGKVISYFNPQKYWTHWEKIKTQNSLLHSTPFSNGYTNNKRFISEIKETSKANSFRSNADFENLKPKNQTQNHNLFTSSTSNMKIHQNGKSKASEDSTIAYQKQHVHNYESRLGEDKTFSGKKNSNDSNYLRKKYVQPAQKHFNYNTTRYENESFS